MKLDENWFRFFFFPVSCWFLIKILKLICNRVLIRKTVLREIVASEVEFLIEVVGR